MSEVKQKAFFEEDRIIETRREAILKAMLQTDEGVDDEVLEYIRKNVK